MPLKGQKAEREDGDIEKESKRDERKWSGRTDSNKWVVFDKQNAKLKDIVDVYIKRTSGVTLFGEIYKKVKAA